MGVQGLWEILEPAGQSHSLTKLAVVDGFENNESGRRGYRIGIDASIWYQHATHSTTEGANPELRLLFFRLARLAKLPWLCLFVFDGRERPRVKRGSKMGKAGSHNLTQKFKEMIECFGMEWRMARGEAEAELAYLNSQGIIDGIITDDVDALVFGARTLIRNASLTLTGNRKNPATDASGKKCDQHAMIFSSDRIASHPSIGLSRGGMILIALLSGGDYDKGVKNLGPKVALGLARCGFGDRLVSAYRMGEAHFRTFLLQWRAEVNAELCTNASGNLPGRRAASMPSSWPDVTVLDAYVNPVCSGTNEQGIAGLALRDKGGMSLPRLAKFCEDHFDEWGHRSRVLERFHNFMYEGAVFHVLRRAALEADEKEKTKRIREGRPAHIREPLRPAVQDGVGTPASLVHRCLDPAKMSLREERLASAFVNRGSQPAATPAVNVPDTHSLINNIVGTRQHAETDKILEYRVVIRCKQLDDLASKGITGKHPSPLATTLNLPDAHGMYGTGVQTPRKAKKSIDRQTKRIWVAASIIRHVHPGLVQVFETKGAPKKTRRNRKGANADEDEDDSDGDFDGPRRVAQESSSSAHSQPAPRPSRPSESISQPTAATRAFAPAIRPLEPPHRPRIMRNVGDINFERPSNPNALLFTFTDPCDPEMLIIENEAPEFVIGSSNMPSASSSQPISRPQDCPVDVREDNSDLNLPYPSHFSAAQDAVIDRALGLTGRGAAGRSRSRKTAAASKACSKVGSAARAQPHADITNESVPPRFASTQEAIIGRAPGLSSTLPNTRQRAAAKRAAPRTQAVMPNLAEPMPSQFSVRQDSMIDKALGLSGAGTSTSTRRRNAPERPVSGAASSIPDEPTSSQYSTRQESMIDRALGLSGRPNASGAKAKKKPTAPRNRAAAPPAVAPPHPEPQVDLEPPASPHFSVAQEVMTNTALALGTGSQAQKRARGPTVAEMEAYRQDAQATKRRKPNIPGFVPLNASTSRMPAGTGLSQLSAPPKRQPAAFPELPTPGTPAPTFNHSSSSRPSPPARPPVRQVPAQDAVIDISDDEPVQALSFASSLRRTTDVRRADAWQMPSSSQDSRLDFDFDFS